MMKVRNVQNIIYLVIIFLFANQAWAADWIFYTASVKGDMYYDKSSIKNVDKNISYVSTKTVYNEDEKKETFSILKSTGKAPDNPDMLSHALVLFEIDCVNEKMKDFFTIIYDKKGKVIYLSTKDNTGEWKNIRSNSVAEKLKKVVCKEPVSPNETIVASKVEKPVVPKEAIVVAPVVTDQKLTHVNSTQNKLKYIPKEDVENLVNRWLTSWKSGDLKTYRSCYALDFWSKGMNLDAWVSHKTNVSQKSQNINISIEKLQISAEENNATAEFIQYYSSSIFKDSGKKKLELRKINGEWKIYREIM